MITFYNDQHQYHQGKKEMFRGEFVPCFEVASRVDRVVDELHSRRFGEIAEPKVYDDLALTSVHSNRYIEFLREAWNDWVALDPENAKLDALPSVWPIRQHRSDKVPNNFSARMGLFSFDVGTPLTAGTWRAARNGAWCALSAVDHVLSGQQSAFALTRPPGHHAGSDFFGGYCFINNAAIAAQALRDGGAKRVAILDIDYHHGNGTQSIFYDREDVFYLSIHADPQTDYPFYLGYEDEKGIDAGLGFNLNIPLPRGTEFTAWHTALLQTLQAITQFQADAVVISLGVDTYEGDPISGFKLQSDDYFRVGEMLASMNLPTVFVFEGGYAIEDVGLNTVNVLEGFQ